MLGLDEIYAPIQDRLKLVDQEIVTWLASDQPAVAEMVRGLLPLAGKRLRPALTLFSAHLNGAVQRPEQVIRLAAVMELMHTATLLHDDVIDEAELRRLQPSLNARWDNARAILLGDFIYSQAFAALSAIGDVRLIQMVSRVAITMSEGEIDQLANRFATTLTEEAYLEVIRRKTASLITACCEGGAMLAEVPSEMAAQLASYGLRLGLAFQIVDDCLDLVGAQETLGKEIGADLASGKFTLPVIHLLQRCSERDRAELLELVRSGAGNGNGTLERIRGLAVQTGAIATSIARARALASAAKECLAAFTSPVRPHLLAIADYVVDRQT